MEKWQLATFLLILLLLLGIGIFWAQTENQNTKKKIVITFLTNNDTNSCTFTNNTNVQMGFSYLYTPTLTGNISITYQWVADMSGNNNTKVVYGINWGDNGDIQQCKRNPTNALGSLPNTLEQTSPLQQGNFYIPMFFTGEISNLTIGKTYWIDVFAQSPSSVGFIFFSPQLLIIEG